MSHAWRRLIGRVGGVWLQPETRRGLRAVAAVGAPLLLGMDGRLPLPVPFVLLAALEVSLLDVRGPYPLRIGYAFALVLMLAVAAELGSLTGGALSPALFGTLLIAVHAGLWRHVSPAYALPMGIPTTVAFFLGMELPHEGHPSAAVAAGGLWGLAIQIAMWLVRPQYPQRRIAAEAWLAAADLFRALADGGGERGSRIAEAEGRVRRALDAAFRTLAGSGRERAITAALHDLTRLAARLTARAAALETMVDAHAQTAGVRELRPALEAAWQSLGNTAGAVAIATVSGQPAHVAVCEVRLRRAGSLVRALGARAESAVDDGDARAELGTALRRIEEMLGTGAGAVRATTDRAGERASFPFELMDLGAWRLRPMAAVLHLASWRPEPLILRHTARVAVLMLLAVLAYKTLGLAHGYWLPLTVVVVLQPDYGATVSRAVQRAIGTLAGGAAAGLLLLRDPPEGVVVAATCAAAFGFAYIVRRNYRLGVLFVTVFVVLIGSGRGTTLGLVTDRLAATAGGGLLALAAAMIFWPMWEQRRFPAIMASALRANAAYLRTLGEALAESPEDERGVVPAKRRAEAATADVYASVERLLADPRARREGAEAAAVLAAGNRRVTRALNVLLVHFGPGAPPVGGADVSRFVACAAETLERLAEAVETRRTEPERLAALRSRLEACAPRFQPGGAEEGTGAGVGVGVGVGRAYEQRVYAQLARVGAELAALLSVPGTAPGAEENGASGENGR